MFCDVCVVYRYKWGSITHQSVGVVRTLNRNSLDVTVDFSEQANWTGVISEMELVPGVHPRHRLAELMNNSLLVVLMNNS